MMAEEGADNASEEDDALDEEDYVSDDYNDEDDVDDPATGIYIFMLSVVSWLDSGYHV